MRIARHTPDELVVDDSPWLVGLLALGVVLIFAGAGWSLWATERWAGALIMVAGTIGGIATLAIFARRRQVVLDRSKGTMTVRMWGSFGYSETIHRLEGVCRAEIETSEDFDGGTTMRPVLRFDGEDEVLPIIEQFTNDRGPERVVRAVNQWLGTNDGDPAG